jgi:predicted ArsR family transcriptional regulator
VESLRGYGRRHFCRPNFHLRVAARVGVRAHRYGIKTPDINDEIIIRGFRCPSASVVKERPELCQVGETLLTEIIGAPVREACVRNGSPRVCSDWVGRIPQLSSFSEEIQASPR